MSVRRSGRHPPNTGDRTAATSSSSGERTTTAASSAAMSGARARRRTIVGGTRFTTPSGRARRDTPTTPRTRARCGPGSSTCRGSGTARGPCSAPECARPSAGRDLEVAGQRGDVAHEAVTPRDLERHERDLPRPARRLERAVDATDVHHVDPSRAMPDGAPDRDRVDDPSVDEVLAIHLDRGQHARHRRGREDRVDERPGGEPALGGRLDRGRDTLEWDAQRFDRIHRHGGGQQPAQALVAVQVGARAGERPEPAEDRAAEDVVALEARPHLREAGDRRDRRLGGHRGAVDRADRRAHHQVRHDTALEQRAEHPHLVGPEVPAASEDEGGRGRRHPHIVAAQRSEPPPATSRAAGRWRSARRPSGRPRAAGPSSRGAARAPA